jgi:prepilin-type N-terminal cleavage/methylation domain-containing protein
MKNILKTYKKIAFTLVEILIALGIIGIISVITIPTLISGYQKRVMASRLKQTHAMLTNVMRMSEEENGVLTNDEIKHGVYLYSNDTKGFFKKYFVPYMAGISYIIYDARNQGRWDSKQPNKNYTGYNFGKGAYCAKNGVCFYFVNHGSNYTYIIVDLNGPSKPNRVGHDVFYFALHFATKGAYIDGKVYAVGTKTSLDNLYDKCATNGGACTEIIIRNGWKIPNDSRYPF